MAKGKRLPLHRRFFSFKTALPIFRVISDTLPRTSALHRPAGEIAIYIGDASVTIPHGSEDQWLDSTPVNYDQFWNDLKSGHFESMVKESSKGQRVHNSQELYSILKPLYAKEPDIESVYFIFLDAKNSILAIDRMFTGSLTGAAIYPREVIKKILQHQASAIIMAHNHPSGDPEPSLDDIAITSRVMLAARTIDVVLHEHVIIGANRYHSMADTGQIAATKRKIEEALTLY